MTWKEFIQRLVIEFCNSRGSRTFTLKEFIQENIFELKEFRPNNRHTEAKVRQQLQLLRDENFISFLGESGGEHGNYTLRGIDLLNQEMEETRLIDISAEAPEKKEYLVETYVRNVQWAVRAREVFGNYCLFDGCSNTFIKEDGTRYIEVHHIVPLCKGGEDGIWNLATLCAHHHRMAHYADTKSRIYIEQFLLSITKSKYEITT